MPVLTLLCALLAYRSLSPQDTPIVPHSWFSIPWKPMLLMSVYGLAFGLRESGLYTSGFGPHSSFGTLAVSAVIFFAILIQGRRFNINLIYRLALPLIVMAFLLLPSFGFFNNVISDFSVSASYGAFSILTMIILASMSYYYGISALWLFGIERGIRALFIVLGRQFSEYIDMLSFTGINIQAIISIVTILLMVTLSLILYSEKDISSRWGISFHGRMEDAADEAVIQKQRLATRSGIIVRKYNLTQRESEVLLLLAQKKSIANIEHDLFIANGTAKTHVQHIYKKLGIHNREELSVLFELVEEPGKYDAEKERPE
jgi:DNA-binding CsgD family transcriptional regulator